MQRILKVPVTVGGVTYAADSVVGDKPGQIPAAVADRITNPKAWKTGSDSEDALPVGNVVVGPTPGIGLVQKVEDENRPDAATGAALARAAMAGGEPAAETTPAPLLPAEGTGDAEKSTATRKAR